MIKFKDKPNKDEEIFKVFNPLVKEWFKEKFKEFSEPQRFGVLDIHNNKNTLISAPTGSGKTLTSTLTIINELTTLAENNLLENKVYCIYINPLKSLSRDIEVNLNKPIQEIQKIAEKQNKELKIKIASRTGDTTTYQKQKMLKETPHILITTPESLSLLLTTKKFREKLKDVRYVVIDEIHALAENKRGTHLSLSLERLEKLSNESPTRIGLSASIAPLDKIAKFLVGTDRDCIISDVQFNKKMDLKVLSPVPDLINTTHEEMNNNLYDMLNDSIQNHKTTLIFTNTRAATERLVHNLKERYPEKYNDNIGAHHGSLSKTHRHDIEDRLRKGELKAVVSSTSLELGIDIGYIDLVICLGSPKSIARTLQRFGRSGHKLHETVKGRIIVLGRDDLVECSVMLKNIIERKIDRIHIPENALDVLAQQIYGIAISDITPIKELFELVKKAYPYRNLTYTNFKEVMDYLSGEHISLEDRHVYAKIWHDEETGMVGKRGMMARIIYMTNIGTIPDESAVKVKVGEQVVGTIDEAFLEKLKKGDVFVLGGDRYMFKYARGMAASVQPAAGMSPTVPSWYSETLPLSFDLASEIQKFRRLMKEHFENKSSKEEILEFIDKYLYVDERGKIALYEYFNHQYKFTKQIPNENQLLIEHFNGQIVFHSLYGRRINDVLSRAMAYVISKVQNRDVEISINDNGFYLTGKEGKKIQVLRAFKLLKSKELDAVARNAIESSEILKRRFRHCAARSLMILRNYKGKTKNVGRQQVSSMILMAAVRRISNEFVILKEARREVLEDLMDIDNAIKILKKIEDGEIKVKEINTRIPSPFAFNILMQGRMDMLRMEDRVEFLRKMHALILEEIK
ncbi:ATP-dependent helicase [Candidatus Woesearchaeota archaeon]|jgi:ATP-dependent helicase Lhr and Lhr-like helicase|nr:ATP-dependent helicase [Candidatus Woesearchaeota archaeon]MBT4322024.1 ATP-dependent helicase [Candidatus Woesearchaeota archaeon]MBT4630770.1 ATP-dependent helicase [Candidatus Woesearchaeota archaeon]